ILFSNRAWMGPIVVGVVLLGIAIIWSWWRSPAQDWVAGACVLLKSAGILALALCLLDPLWVGERPTPGANVFGIIADNSQSLKMKDAQETRSRGEVLREQLTTGA